MSEQIVEVKPRITKSENGRAVEITMPDGTVKYKCQYCGKWILKDENIELESGDYCRHLRESGYDDTALAVLRAERTVAEPPEGWIKTALFKGICRKNSIPISAVVRSFGGDRGLSEPLHPKFRFIYCGKARYVDGWCATKEGLNFLRSVSRSPSSMAVENAMTSEPVVKGKGHKSVKPVDELAEELMSE